MSEEKKPKKIVFFIDKNKQQIEETQNPVTGQFLRSLPPPVQEGYDLWLRAKGHEDDELIKSETQVTVKEGDHFYTAKSVITPGDARH